MTEWTKTGTILTNNDRIYGEFLRKTGAKNVDHYGIMLFGDPMQSDFLKDITMSEYVFGYGDSLSKIAYKEYGDPRYWWLIAWFNTKPTDLHCSIGDKIFVPHPLEEALAQASKRN